MNRAQKYQNSESRDLQGAGDIDVLRAVVRANDRVDLPTVAAIAIELGRPVSWTRDHVLSLLDRGLVGFSMIRRRENTRKLRAYHLTDEGVDVLEDDRLRQAPPPKPSGISEADALRAMDDLMADARPLRRGA